MLEPFTLLRQAGLFPKKAFGQNFLVVPEIAQRIAEACVPEMERGHAYVVEWGAGLGALTRHLLPRAERLLAVERDRDLIPLFRHTFAEAIDSGTIDLVEGDAQTVDTESFFEAAPPSVPHILAGNLPYSITGRLLRRAMHHATVNRAVFMVQAEVADRLLATPGSRAYGALTVFARAAFEIHRVCKVSPACFSPRPNVESAVVQLTRRPQRIPETDLFRQLVQAAFAQRRKTLHNAWKGLSTCLPLPSAAIATAAEACGLSLSARGETLSPEQFHAMEHALMATSSLAG